MAYPSASKKCDIFLDNGSKSIQVLQTTAASVTEYLCRQPPDDDSISTRHLLNDNYRHSGTPFVSVLTFQYAVGTRYAIPFSELM